MITELENVVDQFEQGRLNRRQLIGALLAMAAAPGAAQAQGKAIAPAMNLNHVHLYVADLQRSIKFYGDLLGAKVFDTAPGGNVTLSLPGKPGWISLTETKEKPHINHVGFGVDFDSAKRIAGDALKAYPNAKARETGATTAGENTRTVYLYDPDGLYLQIVPKDDYGWLPTGAIGSKMLKGEK